MYNALYLETTPLLREAVINITHIQFVEFVEIPSYVPKRKQSAGFSPAHPPPLQLQEPYEFESAGSSSISARSKRRLGSALTRATNEATQRNPGLGYFQTGTQQLEPSGGKCQGRTPGPSPRGSRPAFLPMMGFSEVEARGAHSPGLAAQHRSRLSTHSRRSRLAIAPAASRRLSKAQLAGHRGRQPRRRRRRRGGRSPDRAGAGAVGWGGAPPRRPVGNAVPARAAAAGPGRKVPGAQAPRASHCSALAPPPAIPRPAPLPGGRCGDTGSCCAGPGWTESSFRLFYGCDLQSRVREPRLSKGNLPISARPSLVTKQEAGPARG